MDSKTLLIVWLVLVGVGNTINNLLVIAGNSRARVVRIFASTMSAIGWLIFLYILMFHGDVFTRAIELIFSS